jgi:DNA-binding LacI/PurR family transcriptional regulator
VLAAIRDLDYHPNRAARTLATGQSQTLGLIAESSTLYGPASTQAAFAHAATEAGYAVIVATLRELTEDSVKDAIARLRDHQVAGIAVHAPLGDWQWDLLIPSSIPTVLLDGPATGHTKAVTVDQRSGARLATEHLLRAGHRTVHHIAGPLQWYDAQQRLAGWKEALLAADREVPEPTLADWTAQSGYLAGRGIASRAEVTAVFCSNDYIALGVIHALMEADRRVPGDVSIIGFDDVPESAHFLPPLTTVRQDFHELASSAVDALIGLLQGTEPPVAEGIPARLVERETVSPPRTG